MKTNLAAKLKKAGAYVLDKGLFKKYATMRFAAAILLLSATPAYSVSKAQDYTLKLSEPACHDLSFADYFFNYQKP